MSTKQRKAGSGDSSGSSASSGGSRSTGNSIADRQDYVLPVVPRRNPISQAIYVYELWTGLYMLDRWEKFLFNSVVLFVIALTVYYASKLLGYKLW